MPLIPALGRQRYTDLWFRGQPGLQSEFQDRQGYSGKNKQTNKQKQNLFWKTNYLLLLLLLLLWNMKLLHLFWASLFSPCLVSPDLRKAENGWLEKVAPRCSSGTSSFAIHWRMLPWSPPSSVTLRLSPSLLSLLTWPLVICWVANHMSLQTQETCWCHGTV